MDFKGIAKGVKNKPKTNASWIYIYPEPVYSKDNNHPDYRFGIISFFFQYSGGLPTRDCKWMAVTVRQIFLKDWKPNDMLSVLKSEDCAVSKQVRCFEWIDNNNRADITQDPTIITEKGYFGKVVEELDPMTVLIEVDKTFSMSEKFQNEGFWTQMAQ